LQRDFIFFLPQVFTHASCKSHQVMHTCTYPPPTTRSRDSPVNRSSLLASAQCAWPSPYVSRHDGCVSMRAQPVSGNCTMTSVRIDYNIQVQRLRLKVLEGLCMLSSVGLTLGWFFWRAERARSSSRRAVPCTRGSAPEFGDHNCCKLILHPYAQRCEPTNAHPTRRDDIQPTTAHAVR
jgi:hypothetical protein